MRPRPHAAHAQRSCDAEIRGLDRLLAGQLLTVTAVEDEAEADRTQRERHIGHVEDDDNAAKRGETDEIGDAPREEAVDQIPRGAPYRQAPGQAQPGG
jgi:hypothetical protein